MKSPMTLPAGDTIFAAQNFDVRSLEDEIAVDHLCARFLQCYFHHLVEIEKLSLVEAGRLARGADHFLREFIIPDRQENIFAITCDRIRQFAGNWYIVKTLEPNVKELGNLLEGIKSFYRFCSESGKIDSSRYEAIARTCDRLEYYQKRINSFWDIEDDGFLAWDAECPLKK